MPPLGDVRICSKRTFIFEELMLAAQRYNSYCIHFETNLELNTHQVKSVSNFQIITDKPSFDRLLLALIELLISVLISQLQGQWFPVNRN